MEGGREDDSGKARMSCGGHTNAQSRRVRCRIPRSTELSLPLRICIRVSSCSSSSCVCGSLSDNSARIACQCSVHAAVILIRRAEHSALATVNWRAPDELRGAAVSTTPRRRTVALGTRESPPRARLHRRTTNRLQHRERNERRRSRSHSHKAPTAGSIPVSTPIRVH